VTVTVIICPSWTAVTMGWPASSLAATGFPSLPHGPSFSGVPSTLLSTDHDAGASSTKCARAGLGERKSEIATQEQSAKTARLQLRRSVVETIRIFDRVEGMVVTRYWCGDGAGNARVNLANQDAMRTTERAIQPHGIVPQYGRCFGGFPMPRLGRASGMRLCLRAPGAWEDDAC
jgi:hypothetical protein